MAASTATPVPELKTYAGNCHCGAFKYTVSIPEFTSINDCNCSICFKKGYKWIFPGEGLKITKGEETLKEYVFANKTMKHLFCGTCGTGVMGVREGMGIGINANTLNLDFDLYDLKTNTYNGAALDPAYLPPKFSGKEPSAEFEDAKTYYGGCHCGAVTVSMKTDGPLTDGKQETFECDCSICTRNGTSLIRPSTTAFSVDDPKGTLSSYSFGRHFNEHQFCSVCGVLVYIKKNGSIPEDQWKKRKGEDWDKKAAVNLRCFEGVEWGVLREKGLIKRDSQKNAEPVYVCPE